jgi:Transglycosylase SLT domain
LRKNGEGRSQVPDASRFSTSRPLLLVMINAPLRGTTIPCGICTLLAATGATLIGLAHQVPARADPQGDPAASAPSTKPKAEAKSPRASPDEICRTLAQSAVDNQLPIEFFTRVIWQESRFDPEAVSSKGAQGIAQFMPQTASGRGLTDPFEPLQALRESASYLRELRTTFRGSLGLAAAAYNAGPGRVEAWLAGRRGLPSETRAYVRIITGYTADAWAMPQPPQWPAANIPKDIPCVEIAKQIAVRPQPQKPPLPNPAWGPWGVQLAGNWSQQGVLAAYEQLRRKHLSVLGDRQPLVLTSRLPGMGAVPKYLVRISEYSRTSADALCAKLRARGSACVVVRNPPG